MNVNGQSTPNGKINVESPNLCSQSIYKLKLRGKFRKLSLLNLHGPSEDISGNKTGKSKHIENKENGRMIIDFAQETDM